MSSRSAGSGMPLAMTALALHVADQPQVLVPLGWVGDLVFELTHRAVHTLHRRFDVRRHLLPAPHARWRPCWRASGPPLGCVAAG
jgi:hypothetical protein